jgi:hypothetical protein
MAQHSRTPRRGANPPARRVRRPVFTDAPRELVVIAQPEAIAHVAAAAAAPPAALAAAPAPAAALSAVLANAGATMQPLFGIAAPLFPPAPATPGTTAPASPAAGPPGAAPDLAHFYTVYAPDAELDALAAALRGQDTVAAAFIKPPATPPVWRVPATPAAAPVWRVAAAPAAAPPAATPDLNARQEYLDAPPGGVGARAAWLLPGGKGAGVQIIDVEGEWQLTHEDLQANMGGLIGGTPPNDQHWRDHGTAVVGIINGAENGFGITGIAPDATRRVISIFPGGNSASAIRQAADALNPGDIILTELHRPGPRFGFAGRLDQRGFIAIEWWPDDLAAIWYASTRGVLVVEPAGNGGENLDHPIYDANPPPPNGPFPPWWRNPFRRNPLDSNAIVVGAGAPPPGTHGQDHGPDRSRLAFSNWGALIDAQAWGREVTTTGYNDLQGGSEDVWYTDVFSGTSSASPIVVGALASLQGLAKAQDLGPVLPQQARALLRGTGSAQQDGPNGPVAQNIGNRPDIAALFAAIAPAPPTVGRPAGRARGARTRVPTS